MSGDIFAPCRAVIGRFGYPGMSGRGRTLPLINFIKRIEKNYLNPLTDPRRRDVYTPAMPCSLHFFFKNIVYP